MASRPDPRDYNPGNGSHVYELSNGIRVSVIVDPHRPLRFEVLAERNGAPLRMGEVFDPSGVKPGLTTFDVELLLGQLATVESARQPEYEGIEIDVSDQGSY